MKFCPKCGAKAEADAQFCTSCGSSMNSAILSAEAVPAATATIEEIIDLTGKTENSKPQEGRYKTTLFAGVFITLLFVLLVFAGRWYQKLTMSKDGIELFFSLLLVSTPFVLLSILFVIDAKKEAKKTQRKLPKGHAVLLYVVSALVSAYAMVCGFANAFSAMGLLPLMSIFLFAIMAILYVVLCNAYSLQNGEEGYYCLTKAVLMGFILSSPLGFALGMLLRAIEFGVVVLIILFIAFFLLGGRLIFVHRN